MLVGPKRWIPEEDGGWPGRASLCAGVRGARQLDDDLSGERKSSHLSEPTG
jgi:hypothetical protein